MRTLIVAPSIPYPPTWGFGIRVYELARHLARRHHVTLLACAEAGQEEDIAAMAAVGVTVHPVITAGASAVAKRRGQLASLLSPASFQRRSAQTPAVQAAIDALLARDRFDLIQVESSQMGGFDFHGHPRVLLDEHNIEYELLYRTYRAERSPARRLFNWMEYRKLRREERQCWNHAAGCILTSEREERIVRAHAPGKPTATVPNGVDVDTFRPAGVPVAPGRIVFTGLMRYRPNADAALYFTREILPLIHRERPDATFVVVGMGPPAEVERLAGPRVIVTGEVPDVRPHLASAAVCVVPLRIGSGTRLKVLEGLAMGKAMVSTTLGCEGIRARDREHLLVADSPAAFARAVVRILAEPALAASLGRRGRALVEREYSWAQAAQHLEAFHAAMLPISARRQRAPGVPGAGCQHLPRHQMDSPDLP
ncbi:MAG: glycosyltransferase [Armatimonadetes bacterium]|nr:glycosyltransferase [Armatimonadota bacterium]